MAREMKDSGVEWIGEIPKEWKVLSLKFLCSMQSGKNITSEQISREGQYPVYGGNGIRGYFSDYNVDDTVLLVGRQGALCGNVHYVRGRFWATEHAVITKNTSIIDRSYLYYLLIGMNLNQYASDTAAQPGLAVSVIQKVKTCLPSISEQKIISNIVKRECGEIDAVLEKTRASIEEYKKLKQAVITQAVTKGIRPNRPMKDSGITWVGLSPASWESFMLTQIFKQVKCKNAGLIETNLLSLSYGKIKQRKIDAVGGLLPESFDGYNIIEPNDIVLRLTDLQNDQTSLRVGISTQRGIVTSAYLTLHNKTGNNPQFLYYCLHTFDICKGFYGMGSGVRQGLNWDGIKKISLMLPTIEEQQEIAAYLDTKCAELDTLIAKKQQFLTELENYKKSLIYEYVTGKKDVANTAEENSLWGRAT